MKRKKIWEAGRLWFLGLCLFLLTGCGEQKDAATYVERGMEALSEKDFSRAKLALSEAEKLAPGEPRVLRSMGIVYYEEENYNEALNYFIQALSALGERESIVREDILQYKAAAEMKIGDYEAAEADYGLLISLDNEYAEFYLLRGKARAELERFDEASQDFKSALLLAPGNLDYCEDMYLTLKAHGAAEAGMEFLNEILLAGPQEDDKERYAWSCLEFVLFQMEGGQYEEALSLIQEKLSLAGEPVRQELLYAQGVCYEELRDFEKALECFLSYKEAYGADEKVEHEIAFLKTRVVVETEEQG